jgi:hypothetical protein
LFEYTIHHLPTATSTATASTTTTSTAMTQQEPSPLYPGTLYATIRAQERRPNTTTTTASTTTGAFSFSCTTHAEGRHFVADHIVWSTLQGRAFCVQEQERDDETNTATQEPTNTALLLVNEKPKRRVAARITHLNAHEREILVYPTVDPLLMMSFLAIMEEVMLLSNL